MIWDSSSIVTYSGGLFRQRTGTNGIDINGGSPMLQITGGEASNVAITQRRNVIVEHPVTATDSYWLEVNLGTALTNAFCRATVTITTT